MFLSKCCKGLTLFIVIVCMACSSGESETVVNDSAGQNTNNDTDQTPTKSSQADLLSLKLGFESKEFTTSINGTVATSEGQFPFYADKVVLGNIQVSPKATATLKVGDEISIDDSPLNFQVIAEDGTSVDYDLNISLDLGLQLTPNFETEPVSSYKLQVSDVYVDANQLRSDFDRFYFHAYADFNKDENIDVFLASGKFQEDVYSPFFLYQGNGNGVNDMFCECAGECNNYSCDGFNLVENAIPQDLQGLQHPRKILTGDYNGDGNIDVFAIGTGVDAPPFLGESPVLLLNTDGLGFAGEKLNEVSGFYHGGSSADFDHDGDIDIFLIGTPSEEKGLFLINENNQGFQKSTLPLDENIFLEGNYYTAEFIDVDLDGYMDLLIGGHELENAPTLILWGNLSGKYFKNYSTALPSLQDFENVIDIDVEDLDNDGIRDVIVSRVSSTESPHGFYGRYAIQLLKGGENRNFTDITSDQLPNNEGENWLPWVHIQDVNGDGLPDIYYQGDIYKNKKWLNTGNASFNLAE